MVVGLNLLKKTLFSLEERMQMLQRLLVDELASNVVLDSWEGLISEYAKKNGCGVLLRSVRSMADVPYEQMMAAMNSRLGNPLETMIMFSSPELSDISSSAVRELVVSWKRLPHGIVPPWWKKSSKSAMDLFYKIELWDIVACDFRVSARRGTLDKIFDFVYRRQLFWL